MELCPYCGSPQARVKVRLITALYLVMLAIGLVAGFWLEALVSALLAS